MTWTWLPEYLPDLIDGLWMTLFLLVVTCVVGLLLAIPLGYAQAVGPKPIARMAAAYCTVIRGTPLLIQLWFVYFGLGSLFPQVPWIRETWLWPILREALPYAVLTFVISFSAYSGEVMRGAFLAVPEGEIRAARAFGMTRFMTLRRIWLPRAFRFALPTLTGEFLLTLKATPLAATITVFDLFGVATVIRQETYRIYEPLLLIAVIYVLVSIPIVLFMRHLERKGTVRSAT